MVMSFDFSRGGFWRPLLWGLIAVWLVQSWAHAALPCAGTIAGAQSLPPSLTGFAHAPGPHPASEPADAHGGSRPHLHHASLGLGPEAELPTREGSEGKITWQACAACVGYCALQGAAPGADPVVGVLSPRSQLPVQRSELEPPSAPLSRPFHPPRAV